MHIRKASQLRRFPELDGLGLRRLFVERLRSLRHFNGRQLCHIYGWNNLLEDEWQGPTVALNLVRADGSYVGYRSVVC